jgi:hypothetical protein
MASAESRVAPQTEQDALEASDGPCIRHAAWKYPIISRDASTNRQSRFHRSAQNWIAIQQNKPFKIFDFQFIVRAISCHVQPIRSLSGPQFHEVAMSKKGVRLRDKAEELRANADNICVEECHRICLELAATADELADQWDAIDLTIAGYLGDRVAAK